MMENPKDFHHDDLLERAVDAVLRDPSSEQLPAQRLAQLVAVVRQAANQPYRISLMQRIRNMKPMTKLAVAASFLIAFFGLFFWLLPGSGVAIALADVAEALHNVHSATWKITTVASLKPPGAMKERTITNVLNCMFMASCYERSEAMEGEKIIGIVIADTGGNKMLNLDPVRKMATLTQNIPSHSPVIQSMLEYVAKAPNFKAGKVEQLGLKTIDGRPAVGVSIKTGTQDMRIWADPKTMLPIRIEQTHTSTSGDKGSTVLSDFRFNADLDKSLFSIDVPPGYTVRTFESDESKRTWRDLADALRMTAESNNGVFPPTLHGEQGVDGVVKRAVAAFEKTHGKDLPESLKQSTDIAKKLRSAAAVLDAMQWSGAGYAGKDVKLGTPNRPILWHKSRYGQNFLIIYADLSIKEVSPEEARKFPLPDASSRP